jgi:PTS system nitrogen regulatory IIA component
MSTVRLADYLAEDHLFWDLSAPDKDSLLRAMAARIVSHQPGVDADMLLDLLLQREAVQSTGIGDGLALPHAMVPGTETTALYVGRVTPAVEYEALDDAPVDLVFLLLSPSDGLKQHVRLLARVARIIGQSDLLDRLRVAARVEDAYGILLDEDSRHVY